MTKSQLSYYSGFVRGITEAISDAAFKGPSSMTARVLKGGYMNDVLAKELGVKDSQIELVPIRKSFIEYLTESFGWDRETAWNLERRLGFVVGKPTELFAIKDDREIREYYSGYGGGNGPFYFTEDLFVASFPELTVLFIVGNDE